jgi:hypothetical protein
VTGLLAAMALIAAPAPAAPRDFEARMRASAAAAQALQGELDGAWRLDDGRGRTLYILQITDPSGGGPLEGGWRGPGQLSPFGPVDAIERRGAELALTITPDGSSISTTVRLTRRRAGLWRGWITRDGRTTRAWFRRAP